MNKIKKKGINHLIKKWKSYRKRLLDKNVAIIKNSILLIYEIGFPVDEEDVENLKYAVEKYEMAVKEVEDTVNQARAYIKEKELCN